MRNHIKLTDRLSASNQYYNKRKPRKLGLIGKVLLGIAALLIVSILVYELNSSSNTTSEPLISTTGPAPVSSQDEKLDQQYQELLKRGQKYTNTKRADSIRIAAAKIVEAERETKKSTILKTPSSKDRIDPPTNNTVPKRTARLEPSSKSNIKTKRETTVNKKADSPISKSGSSGAKKNSVSDANKNSSSDAKKNSKIDAKNSGISTDSNNDIKSPEPSISSSIASSSGLANDGPVEEVYYPAQSLIGTVTSAADGTGISGVNVMVKGGTQGTVTDWKGNYSIDLTAGPGPRHLQFNYKGNLVEREVRPGKNTLNVKL